MSSFYREISKLKDVLRRGWIIRGLDEHRVESDAEHTFSMCLLAMEVIKERYLELDELKVYKLILCHELGEIDAGDITPLDGVSSKDKQKKELDCIDRIVNISGMQEVKLLVDEYIERKTPESKFVKVIDKLDCVLQAKIYAEKYNKPELYQEFYDSSYEIIKEYLEFLK